MDQENRSLYDATQEKPCRDGEGDLKDVKELAKFGCAGPLGLRSVRCWL